MRHVFWNSTEPACYRDFSGFSDFEQKDEKKKEKNSSEQKGKGFKKFKFDSKLQHIPSKAVTIYKGKCYSADKLEDEIEPFNLTFKKVSTKFRSNLFKSLEKFLDNVPDFLTKEKISDDMRGQFSKDFQQSLYRLMSEINDNDSKHISRLNLILEDLTIKYIQTIFSSNSYLNPEKSPQKLSELSLREREQIFLQPLKYFFPSIDNGSLIQAFCRLELDDQLLQTQEWLKNINDYSIENFVRRIVRWTLRLSQNALIKQIEKLGDELNEKSYELFNQIILAQDYSNRFDQIKKCRQLLFSALQKKDLVTVEQIFSADDHEKKTRGHRSRTILCKEKDQYLMTMTVAYDSDDEFETHVFLKKIAEPFRDAVVALLRHDAIIQKLSTQMEKLDEKADAQRDEKKTEVKDPIIAEKNLESIQEFLVKIFSQAAESLIGSKQLPNLAVVFEFLDSTHQKKQFCFHLGDIILARLKEDKWSIYEKSKFNTVFDADEKSTLVVATRDLLRSVMSGVPKSSLPIENNEHAPSLAANKFFKDLWQGNYDNAVKFLEDHGKEVSITCAATLSETDNQQLQLLEREKVHEESKIPDNSKALPLSQIASKLKKAHSLLMPLERDPACTRISKNWIEAVKLFIKAFNELTLNMNSVNDQQFNTLLADFLTVANGINTLKKVLDSFFCQFSQNQKIELEKETYIGFFTSSQNFSIYRILFENLHPQLDSLIWQPYSDIIN